AGALPSPGLPLPGQPANKINVSAWVNGKPLFEEEVFQGLPPDVANRILAMPPSQRNEELNKIKTRQLEGVIDQQVLYQDAVAKLEKMNPRALDKLKGHANEEFEKQMKRIRESARVPEDQLRDLRRLLHRKTEREFISSEYMRSKIFPTLRLLIGPV